MLTEENQNKILISEAFKISILFVVLALLIVSQFFQVNFIHKDLLFPCLFVLFIGFAFHTAFVFLSRKKTPTIASYYSVFIFDVILITSLIHYIGNSKSLFVILYLINILLSGWLLNRKGAMMIAAFTSLSFSALLAVGQPLRGQTLVLTFGLNNFAFFVVAAFSAYMGEYFNRLSDKLEETKEDLGLLKDLNHLIIDSMPSGFVSVDMLGRVLVMNQSAEMFFSKINQGQFRIEELLPGVEDKYHNLKEEYEGENLAQAVIQFDYEMLDNLEERKILNISASDIYGKHGVQIGRMYLFSDQTRERQLEQQMKRKEKLAAVGQLAAGIAHEIRNPLASMSGSIQFMNESLPELDDDSKKLMGIVLKETDRLNDLISDFMDFVKEEPKVNDKVNIEKLVKECLEQIRFNRELREGVKITPNLETGKVIWGNEAKLKQVVLNLIINAHHAMDKTDAPELQVSTEYRLGHLYLKIKDNGSGMNEKVKARLFEPFHTTKPKGTGLGLATVHKILENHNAGISVDSTEGVGTEFKIDFTRLV